MSGSERESKAPFWCLDKARREMKMVCLLLKMNMSLHEITTENTEKQIQKKETKNSKARPNTGQWNKLEFLSNLLSFLDYFIQIEFHLGKQISVFVQAKLCLSKNSFVPVFEHEKPTFLVLTGLFFQID